MTGPVNGYAAAVEAYNRAGQPAPREPAPAQNPQDDFADLVQGAIRQAVAIGQTSETLSIAAINDRADLGQVVTAVAEAETTLQTVVSIRDKVIEAYKDIIRMPI